MLDKGVLKVA